MKKIKQIIENWKARIDRFVEKTKDITFPGFGQLSLYDVGSFFIKSLSGGTLGIRSAAIAFNFFLALFPAVLFLFTIFSRNSFRCSSNSFPRTPLSR